MHQEVWRELPSEEHGSARVALRELARSRAPGRAAAVNAVQGSSYPHSYRLRLGAYRLLFTMFPHERTIYVTTAFRKKRESDYVVAIQRHDRRIRDHE